MGFFALPASCISVNCLVQKKKIRFRIRECRQLILIGIIFFTDQHVQRRASCLPVFAAVVSNKMLSCQYFNCRFGDY